MSRRPYFEGLYFKHQKGDQMLALIPGRADDGAFIQVLTPERSYHIPFAAGQVSGQHAVIGENSFSRQGINLHIATDALCLTGSLSYRGQHPLRSDIMGPFRYLPMECRHQVVSMDHEVAGRLCLNGKIIDFTGGRGYIEGDRGRSFPRSYTWLQCNSFRFSCSVMVSLAEIPLGPAHFWGCIAALILDGVEYRLSTYQGVRILCHSPERIELQQGRYRLCATLPAGTGHILRAPAAGVMTRRIRERPSCPVHIRFSIGGKEIFNEISPFASFEHTAPDMTRLAGEYK